MSQLQLFPKEEPIYIQSPYYFKQPEFENALSKSMEIAGFNELNEIQSKQILFDLSRTYYHDLGTLLWLIALLHKLKKQGNILRLLFPEISDAKGRSVWDFLLRWRFFETLSLCVDAPVNLLKAKQLPYLKIESKYSYGKGQDQYGEDSILHTARILEMSTFIHGKKEESEESLLSPYMNRIADKIIVMALSRRCGWDLDITKDFVHIVCGEGLRNSILHAEGSFSTIAMKMDKKNLILAISDNGIGIPNTLRHAFFAYKIKKEMIEKSDSELIKYYTEPEMIIDSSWIKLSVKKGTSSKAEHRKGLGLYYLKTTVLNNGGELRIRSGKACVDFLSNGKVDKEVNNMIDSPGTMIRILVPVK